MSVPFAVPLEIVMFQETFKVKIGIIGWGKSYVLVVRPDVKTWCKQNKITICKITHTARFGDYYLGPFAITIKDDKKAALFRLWWC